MNFATSYHVPIAKEVGADTLLRNVGSYTNYAAVYPNNMATFKNKQKNSVALSP
jgi:hypothetical protein